MKRQRQALARDTG